MSSVLILTLIACYFLLLFIISYLTTRKIDHQSFYTGNRKSPWYIISIAMVGTSISGVTFISVPGWVLTNQFSYLQMVLGFVFGYITIAQVLLPLFYKLRLPSIYSYLSDRFGKASYKTGSFFFLLSRTLGSAFRLFVVAIVLQKALFDALNVPFVATVALTISLIFLYTRKGGVKTVIWTDTVQTLVLISTVIVCMVWIARDMNLSFAGMVQAIADSGMAKVWHFNAPASKQYFWKQFLAGVFTVIVMTGLDQDQMQKNLSCRNLKEAQKNMYWYGCAFFPINLIFLSLGVLLVLYARQNGVALPQNGDELFPLLATGINPQTGTLFFGSVVGIMFILGIISAAYSSADSALTALTTSFTVDILDVRDDDPRFLWKRTMVHVGLSVVLGVIIILFRVINNDSVIKSIYMVAGYTYGPLLGLYAFGLFTRYRVHDKWVPLVAILSPVLCYLFSRYSDQLLFGYKMGFEVLILNGALTFLGLFLLRRR